MLLNKVSTSEMQFEDNILCTPTAFKLKQEIMSPIIKMYSFSPPGDKWGIQAMRL